MNKIMSNIMGFTLQTSKSGMNKKNISNLVKNINFIKTISNEGEFDRTFNEMMAFDKKNFVVIRNHYIINNLFPIKIEALRTFPTLKFSEKIDVEIRWRCQIFKHYSEKLSEFIKLRKQYDKLVLLGRYDDAIQILEKVKELYGISFWYMESLFFIYKKLGKDIRGLYEQEKPNLTKTILSYYELKNREKMTCNEYEQVVKMEMNALSKAASNDNKLKELAPYLNYRIMPLTFVINEKNILELLKKSAEDTLIDQYILCLNIFDVAMNECEESDIYIAVKNNIKLLAEINDNHLEALRFVFDDNKTKFNVGNQLQEAKSYFINNELIKARNIVIDILSAEPYNIQALNLLVELNLLLQNNDNKFGNTILGELIVSLMSVYPMAEDRDENIDAVFKYLNCCSQSEWANFISKTINYRCSLFGTKVYKSEMKKASVQCLDIETICNCLEEKQAIDYIDKLNQNDNYTYFRKLVVCHKFEQALEKSQVDVIKSFMKIRGNKHSLKEKLNLVNNSNKYGSTIELMMKNSYISQIDLKENLMDAVEFAIDILIDNIYTSLFVPIKQLIEFAEQSDEEIWGNICIPILYYIRYRYYDKETKSDVCAKTEDFLFFAGIDVPSKIANHTSTLQEKRVIYFLRNLCSQEILSTALAAQIDNSKDLLQERINICSLLCELDSTNKKEYENEIRNIMQKKRIDSELRIIQENRINVNIEGIRADLVETQNADFLRYKLYRDNSINDLIRAIRAKQENIILYENASDRVLRKLIDNIRDAFVSSNEYGLDGYLSMNIRHGAISDALRKPLYKQGLLVIFDSENNDYVLSSRIVEITEQKKDFEKLVDTLKKFTNKTDEIINDLRDKYIRVKKNDSYPEGIFDYNIEPVEYDNIRRVSENFYEFEDLLDYMFEFLWDKTEKNLNRMKELLHDEISERYKLAFAELQDEIDNFEAKENIPVLKSRILEASNDMSNTINKIMFWFQRSGESKNTDFNLEFVFELGLETIKSMHSEVIFNPKRLKCEIDNQKIEGKYLKAYSDIIYNLLDNIYKNALKKNNCIEFEYLLEQYENEQHILLKNPYDCSKNMKEEDSKIQELKEILNNKKYLDRIGTEGGTGIPKICKLISVDLKKEFNINLGFEKKQNFFFIELFIRR